MDSTCLPRISHHRSRIGISSAHAAQAGRSTIRPGPSLTSVKRTADAAGFPPSCSREAPRWPTRSRSSRRRRAARARTRRDRAARREPLPYRGTPGILLLRSKGGGHGDPSRRPKIPCANIWCTRDGVYLSSALRPCTTECRGLRTGCHDVGQRARSLVTWAPSVISTVRVPVRSSNPAWIRTYGPVSRRQHTYSPLNYAQRRSAHTGAPRRS